ncbi:MAG TPA: cytochrome c biogenesis protein CcsA [Burkholderiales bacterium]|nr:cytochrome c biogenesis protein CcsA [Burkholderiales bacterium]
MNDILLHLLVSFGYAGLAIFLWRNVLAPTAAQGASSRPAWAHTALFVPLLLHAVLLARAMFAGDAFYLGVGTAVSVIIWLTALIYWAGGFFYRLEGLQVLVIPTAAVLSLLPLATPSPHPLTNTHLTAFKAHLVISLLAYSLFTIASLHVLMMAVMERRLHKGNLPQFMRNLPPLLTMEQLLFRIIFAGFILLTLTLGSGILFSEELFGKPMQFTHKTVFGILSWIIFGSMLAGRALYGWRGRVAMRWTLAGFLSLVLAYIGSKFVLEVLLQR